MSINTKMLNNDLKKKVAEEKFVESAILKQKEVMKIDGFQSNISGVYLGKGNVKGEKENSGNLDVTENKDKEKLRINYPNALS